MVEQVKCDLPKDKDRICFVFQPYGLGDILFIQKIIKYLAKDFKQVIIPVSEEHAFLNKRLMKDGNVQYVNVDKQFPHRDDFCYLTWFCKSNVPRSIFNYQMPDYVFVPFHYAWVMDKVTQLKIKYDLVGLKLEGWQDFIQWKSYPKKEDQLYEMLLREAGLKPGDKFCLYNPNFADKSNPELDRSESIGIENFKTNLPMINMRYVDGFDLFDWRRVFQEASVICSVETSIIYLVEAMGAHGQINPEQKRVLYTRHKDDIQYGIDLIDYIFKLEWDWVREPFQEYSVEY